MKALGKSRASSPGAGSALDLARSTVTVRAGEIYWDGVWKSRADATRLRDHFAANRPDDWFSQQSHAYAAALTEALRLTEKEHA